MSKLILIDGSAVAYRAYFAFIRNPLINSRGENTGAVFGFINSLMKIIKEHKPDYIAVVFDTAAPTFRHKIHADYKATRPQMPVELIEQLPWINQAIDAFRIKTLRIEGYEADDIIGTLSERAARTGMETLLFSGDKDFFQLVRDDVRILHPRDFAILDAAGVKERFGVLPEQVIDTLALMGDTSDNIPGIPGVGPKTAVGLIEEFGNLDKVLEDGPKKRKGKLSELLKEHADLARLSRELATIMTDCPIQLEFDELKTREPDLDSLVPLLRRLEFKGLADKFAAPAAENLFDQQSEKTADNYKAVQTLDELDTILAEAEKKTEIALDTETTGLEVIEAGLVGISLSMQEGTAFYFPVGHAEGSNLPKSEVLGRFSRFFQSKTKIIGHNIKFDRQILRNHGVEMRNLSFDTMIGAYLLEPGKRSYDMDSLALEYFNYRKVSITELIGSGKKQISFARVPIEKAAPYACEDADFTLRLKSLLEPQLAKLKLQPLMNEIEMPLVPVLGDMEAAGVRIDTGFLKELSLVYGQKMKEVEERIYKECGEIFNINSPRQLGKILFDKLKLASTRRTAKGGARATSVDILEKLAEAHPVPRMVLEYRQLMKLKSTYVDALPLLVSRKTGRVHTSFNQTIAATGRLSSSDPNLQNIPIKTEEGREIRKAFIPGDKDFRILSADYSQIELRIMAHFANDSTMIKSFQASEDIHRRTAAEVYGVDIKDVSPEQRRAAKTANFAIIYGVSAYGLSQQSELSLTESKDFIDIYFERYPGIRKYTEEIKEFARKNGYVTTLFDRRRYLTDINAQSAQARQFAERMAINMPIQGTAADMIKIAMIRIADKMRGMKSRMILQVHDELVFDVHVDEVDRLREMVVREMEGAVKLRVPIKADVAVGQNWLEAK
ncbi:MAG: DNA polymerase I [candidate division Zixibacteria bacterium RBG_16_53_22]|nr:MAG: DNA polymerase I [candidate division Zixibacteria bacterium RBG_16_53_22]